MMNLITMFQKNLLVRLSVLIFPRSYLQNVLISFCSHRGVFRTLQTSKMERSAKIVTTFKPLTNVARKLYRKCSIVF